MANSITLKLIQPGGTKAVDITNLYQVVTWAGNIQQTCRELTVALAVPKDGSVTPPPLEEGSVLVLAQGSSPLFTGPLVDATTTTQSVVTDLYGLDNGRFLTGNEGWYQFSGATPEAATRTICNDFGIPYTGLAGGGAGVTRKFAGIALDRIIKTMYNLAGNQTGKQFLIRFTGEGKLSVVERPTTATLSIQSTMGVTNTWSIADLQNSVAIYTSEGQLVRRIQDNDSIKLNGRLEHVITQRDGEDATAEAKTWLEEHGLQQKVTVEVVPGDTRLITGDGVILKDTGSGVSGLFWIDADTHTWKNGQYYTKLTLNFRRLADSTEAGTDKLN